MKERKQVNEYVWGYEMFSKSNKVDEFVIVDIAHNDAIDLQWFRRASLRRRCLCVCLCSGCGTHRSGACIGGGCVRWRRASVLDATCTIAELECTLNAVPDLLPSGSGTSAELLEARWLQRVQADIHCSIYIRHTYMLDVHVQYSICFLICPLLAAETSFLFFDSPIPGVYMHIIGNQWKWGKNDDQVKWRIN